MGYFVLAIAPENTLLKVGHFVKTIVVQLSYEGAKFSVFEPMRKNFFSKTFMIIHWNLCEYQAGIMVHVALEALPTIEGIASIRPSD